MPNLSRTGAVGDGREERTELNGKEEDQGGEREAHSESNNKNEKVEKKEKKEKTHAKAAVEDHQNTRAPDLGSDELAELASLLLNKLLERVIDMASAFWGMTCHVFDSTVDAAAKGQSYKQKVLLEDLSDDDTNPHEEDSVDEDNYLEAASEEEGDEERELPQHKTPSMKATISEGRMNSVGDDPVEDLSEIKHRNRVLEDFAISKLDWEREKGSKKDEIEIEIEKIQLKSQEILLRSQMVSEYQKLKSNGMSDTTILTIFPQFEHIVEALKSSSNNMNTSFTKCDSSLSRTKAKTQPLFRKPAIRFADTVTHSKSDSWF